MLRNCELKITTWAIGVAVYTVQDTKVKCSRLETHTNRETIVLTLLCTLVSLLAGIWLRDHSNELGVIPYFRKKDFSNPNEIENYKWYSTTPRCWAPRQGPGWWGWSERSTVGSDDEDDHSGAITTACAKKAPPSIALS
uniref:Uncharacterized protein n=1 Tax=Oryza nivara TaxID=4536 RepID=A0A0E0HQQ2_ORYNI